MATSQSLLVRRSDSQCPFVSLVALITRRDLLLRAKHLFVAAISGSSICHWRQDSRPRGRRCRLRQPAGGSCADHDGDAAMSDEASPLTSEAGAELNAAGKMVSD